MVNLFGRVCLITGGTHGLGRATAVELAKFGATVVVVGDDLAKARYAVQSIRADAKSDRVNFLIGDLSLIRGMQQIAKDFADRYDHLHVLINNVGAFHLKRQLTSEGIERTFALNHLSYFLLTNLLLDVLVKSGTERRTARVINVAGMTHEHAEIDFHDLQLVNNYNGLRAYARSKLMNIMFSYELARRLNRMGAPVTSNALHPGLVNTGLMTDVADGVSGTVINGLTKLLRPLGVSPEKGAETQVYLATSPDVEGFSGKYFVKSTPKPSSPRSMIESDWQKLWTITERICGLESRVAAS